jgi:hypothetical protein
MEYIIRFSAKRKGAFVDKLLVLLLISCGACLAGEPQAASPSTLEDPVVVVARAKTISVAPISPPPQGAIRNKGEARHDKDNLFKTNELRKSVKKWLEKNAQKEHAWSWSFTDDFEAC